jgi:hypothetical protein
MSFHVYIGPVAEIPFVQGERKTVRLVCASNCGNKSLTGSMKFCPQCGSVVERHEEVQSCMLPADPFKLSDSRLHELLWAPMTPITLREGTSMWLPNRHGHGLTLSRDMGHTAHDLPEYLGQAAIERFTESFSEVLAAARTELKVEPRVIALAVTFSH